MNKFVAIFFLTPLLLASMSLSAQLTDPDGCSIPGVNIQLENDVEATLPVNGNKAYTIRALSEINKVDTAESYPCLSPDGLRLYFIQGVAGNSAIKVASRTDPTSFFGSPVILSNAFPVDGLRGCWISADETEIYYVNNDILYFASRPSLSDPFSMPSAISLTGNVSGALFGASLSPDGQELFISNSGTGKLILVFSRSGSMAFTLSDTLDIPVGYTAGVGQLSRDGLQYIVSLTNSSTLRTTLFQYDRAAPGDIFNVATLSALDTNVNNVSWVSNTHPTLSSDGLVLAWVRNQCGTLWVDNDLYLGTDAAVGDYLRETVCGMEISPNPSQGIVNVKFRESAMAGEHLLIWDAKGHLLIRMPVQGSACRVDLSSLAAGNYFFKLESTSGSALRLILQ